MADIHHVTWISYADIERYEDPYESLQEPDRRPHPTEDLYSITLVQRDLEEAKPVPPLRLDLPGLDDEAEPRKPEK